MIPSIPYIHATNIITLRIVIVGGPRTGKTTLADALAQRFDIEARHTDDLLLVSGAGAGLAPLGWSEQSEAVAAWFDEPGPWIVEGTTCARALRKWLLNPTGCLIHANAAPCDVVLGLTTPFVELTKGQSTMKKGCDTVYEGIVGELTRRGVKFNLDGIS